MLARRIVFISLGSFCVGAASGYFFRPAPATSAVTVAPVKPPPSTAPAADRSSSTFAKTQRADAPVASGSAVRANRLRERLESLRWQRRVGVPTNVLPFIGDRVSPQFAQMLDLDETQLARLLAAATTAQQQIEQLRNLRATAHRSDDHKQLIVDLPALDPATSRSIYDQFNAQLSATLDADRLALANEIAGENLERLYDRFGLNAVRYELTLEPVSSINATPVFTYKRRFVDADGVSTGWSGSTLTLDQMRKSDPVLARFFATPDPDVDATPHP